MGTAMVFGPSWKIEPLAAMVTLCKVGSGRVSMSTVGKDRRPFGGQQSRPADDPRVSTIVPSGSTSHHDGTYDTDPVHYLDVMYTASKSILFASLSWLVAAAPTVRRALRVGLGIPVAARVGVARYMGSGSPQSTKWLFGRLSSVFSG